MQAEALEPRQLLAASSLVTGADHAASGSPYTLNLNAVAQANGSQWAIDWGDGSAVQNVATGTAAATHTFAGPAATRTITASLTNGLANPLDRSFGNLGGGKTVVSTPGVDDKGFDVAVQPDGKLLVAGSSGLTVARFNADGSVDATFGTNGRVTAVGGVGTGYGLVLQDDGKILVGGGENFALARFNANGTPDATFGTNGVVSSGFGSTYAGYDLAVVAGGKIVEVGTNGGNNFIAARFNANGSLDATFGTNGKATLDFFGSLDKAFALAVQPDGKLLLGGQARDGSANYQWALARYTANGAIDTTFGTNGKVTTELGHTDDAIWDLQLQSDGKIVAAGRGGLSSSTGYDFAAARYTTSGVLDTSFGTNGITKVDFGYGGDQAYALEVLPGDKLLLAGRAQSSSNAMNFGLLRLNANGTVDTTFGSAGKVSTDFSGSTDEEEATVLLPDGSVVLAGGRSTVGANGEMDFALAKYHLSTSATLTVAMPPVAASGLSAAVLSPTSIALAWDDLSSNEAGFRIERRTAGGTWGAIDSVPANTTSYNDATAVQQTAYDYRVIAFNQTADASASNSVSVTTPQPGPAAPTVLTATANTSTAVLLTWIDNAAGEDRYVVERKTGNGDWLTLAAALPADSTTMQDITVVGSTTYSYRVRAFAGQIASDYSNVASLQTPANTAPVITSTPVTEARSGKVYNYQVVASDADRDLLTYSLTTSPDGMTIDSSSGLISWRPSTGQTVNVVLAVSDGQSGTTIQSFALVVDPVMTVTISGNASVVAGAAYTLHLQASSPTSTASSSSIQFWSIDWGDGTVQSPDVQTIYGNPANVDHVFPATGGTFSITATATDENGTYKASDGNALAVTVTGANPANGALTIVGPDAGSIGSLVELTASGGRVSGGSATIDYVWSVSLAGTTIATGRGASFAFPPKSAGSYVVTVTALNDQAGPSIASHVVGVTVPDGATIPIEGPDRLEVGHLASFNFDESLIWKRFGTAQHDAWEHDALAAGRDDDPSQAGPTFQWTVRNSSGTDVTPAPWQAGRLGLIVYPYNFRKPPSLTFAATTPGLYTISLQIDYEGKTYFQNAETLDAIVSAVVDVKTAVIAPPFPNVVQRGDSVVENGDGTILVLSENNSQVGDWSSPQIEVTKYNGDLTPYVSKTNRTPFGNGGSIFRTFAAEQLSDQNETSSPSQWMGHGFQLATDESGKFIVAGTLTDDGSGSESWSPFKDEYESTDPSDGQLIRNRSVWVVLRYNADGTPDETFGTHGVYLDRNDQLNYLQTLAVEPNGSILLGGSGFQVDNSGVPALVPDATSGSKDRPCFLVEKLRSDGGDLDRTFGEYLDAANPTAARKLGGGRSFVNVGSDQSLMSKREFSQNSPTSWGTESALSIALQSDGHIVVGGLTSATRYALNTGEFPFVQRGARFALIRLDPLGRQDRTFGDSGAGGNEITTFPDIASTQSSAEIRNIAIDSAGHIVAMGSVGVATGPYFGPGLPYQAGAPSICHFAIARYTANGHLDTTFDGDGLVVSNIFGREWAYAGMLTADDDIVLAGQTLSGGLIARFKNDGSPDPSFGTGGHDQFNVGPDGVTAGDEHVDDQFRSVIPLANRDILVVGSGYSHRQSGGAGGMASSHDDEVVIARYHPHILKVSDLVATATPAGPINLSWVNKGGAQDGFRILRGKSPGDLSMPGAVLASIGPGQTSYSDASVDPNTTYYYQIIAFETNPSGALQLGNQDGYSNVARVASAAVDTSYVLEEVVPVTIFGETTSSMTILQAGVTYMLQASGNISQTLNGTHRGDAEYAYFPVSGVTKWRDKGTAADGYDYGISALGTRIGTGDGAATRNKNPFWGPLSTDANHTYQILVVGDGQPLQVAYHDSYYPDNTQGNAGDIALTVSIFRALPGAPGNLLATSDHASKIIGLTWTNNASATNESVTSLIVQRADGASADNDNAYQTIATLPPAATAFVDAPPSIAFNRLYAYRVIAENTFGRSGPSNIAFSALTNFAPQVPAIPPQIAYDGTSYAYSVQANDPEDGKLGLTYALAEQGSSGSSLAINANTGQITWAVPAVSANGSKTWSGRVVVSDQDGLTTSVPFNVALAPPLSSFATGVIVPTISADGTKVDLTVTPSDGGTDISEYRWETVSQPGQAGAPSFSMNGSKAAASTQVTLHGSGTYTFRVMMNNRPTDEYGNFQWPGSAEVTVSIGQRLGSVIVTPGYRVAAAGSTVALSASALDQFLQPMSSAPTFAWSISGTANGNVSSSGLYTAPASTTGTPSDVLTASATVGGITRSGLATISVPSAPPKRPLIDEGQPDATPQSFSQIQLSVTATDPNHADGDSHLIYVWETLEKPASAAWPIFLRNGSNAAKTTIVNCDPAFALNYRFQVTVMNDLGQASEPGFIDLSDARTLASITLTPQHNVLGVGKTQQLVAGARDQYGRKLTLSPQATFAWTIDGVSAGAGAVSGPNGTVLTYVAPAAAGPHQIVATLTVGTATAASQADVAVVASGPPTMQIISPGGSLDGPLTADAPVTIISADPDGDAAPWQLWLVPADAPAGSTGTKLAASDQSLGELGGAPGTAATLHVATYPNGVYTLQLKDAAGTLQDSKRIEIKTQLKLGNLTLPFTDMTATLPGGQSASVGRTYDSSQAGVNGELGYGWTLDLSDAHLHTTTQPLAGDPSPIPALCQGDVVYLTLPGGEQHAFAFVPEPLLNDAGNPLFGVIAGIVPYYPRFVSVDGSNAKLTVKTDVNGDAYVLHMASGRLLDPAGRNYNPAAPGFGDAYVVTTDDGTRYEIKASTGRFVNVSDANGNATNVASAFTVASTTLGTDRIVTVTNNANTQAKVVYTINNIGDLHSVRSPTGELTTYAYDNHRLTGITDARGITVLTAAYDAVNGQLASLVNSNGDGAPIDTGSFDGVRADQTVADPAGNKTETIYDDFGDVVRTIETVADPVTKVVSGYRVTVGGVSRFKTDRYNPVADGVSLYGSPQIETHGLPFFVAGSDPTGLRYTASPAIAQSVIKYDYNNDEADPLSDTDLRQPIEQRSYLGTFNGKELHQTTTMRDYVLGKPRHVVVTTDSVDATGVVHSTISSSTTSTFDEHGNLTQQKDELSGAITLYTYTDGGDGLPVGLPLTTARARSAAATPVPVSSNACYTPADVQANVPGAILGKLKSSTTYAGDGTPRATFYAYDANGNAVLTWTPKTWHKSDGTSVSGWTTSATSYDLAGRAIDTYSGTYLGTGAPSFTVTQATATTPGSVAVTSPLYDDATQAQASAGATPVHTGHTAYDADGQVTDATDQYGGHTLTTYDASGRAIRVQNADGTETRTVYDSMGRAVWQTDRFVPANADLASPLNVANATHTLYDSSGQAWRAERYAGVAVTLTADAAHAGLSTSSVVAPSSAAISATQTWYDEQGRAIEQRDAGGLRTGTTYDDAGNVSISGVLKGTASDGGRVVSNADGTTSFAFSATDFEPTGATTQHLYDNSSGQPWSGLVYTRSTDALGHHTDSYQSADGLTSYTVFDDGSFTESIRGNGDQPIAGFDFTPTIPLGGGETVEVAQRKPGDPVVATIRVSDRAGELVDVYAPAVPDAKNGNALTRPHTHYAYDADGNEVAQVDADGHETAFAYDENGNEVSRTLPDGERETYAYDQNGQQVRHVDFDGNVATSTYATSGPQAGMLQQVVYAGAPGSGKATQTVGYTYDALGRRQTITDASGTTTDHYDGLGELIEADTPEGVIHYGYDAATGRHTETYTDFTDTLYGYDARGRLATVTVKKLNGTTLATPLVTTYAYDVAGNKQTETLPEGEVTTYGYDGLNRLTSQTETLNGTILFGETFVLNDDGTRHSAHEAQRQADGSTVTTDTTWTYDADDRLIGESVTSSIASESYADTFGYDLANNRVSKTHVKVGVTETSALTLDADDRLVKEVSSLTGETDYTYDPNGSQLTSVNGGNASAFAYDARNRLASTTIGSLTSTFVYDDIGNRVRETTGNTTSYFVTDENSPVGYPRPLEVRASLTSTPTTTYLLGDRVFGQADLAGVTAYLLTDGHGSTQQSTSSTGSVTAAFRYDAFGGALNFTPSTAGTAILFGGDAVYDTASGLFFHGSGRQRVGYRFVEADPEGYGTSSDPSTLHRYTYAGGNPVIATDSSGHFIDFISTLLVTYGRASFETASFSARYSRPIGFATVVAGTVFFLSSIELALEQNGFLPTNNYTPYLVALSGVIFTAGETLQSLGQQTVQITSPLRGCNGKIINGREANLSAGTPLPPYAEGSLAAEGKIGSGVRLVRVYAPGVSAMVGQFCVEASEIEGLSASEMQSKLALPALPTRIVDVDATGQAARTGITGANFGQPGGGPQVQLLPPYGAKFVNDRPLPSGGF